MNIRTSCFLRVSVDIVYTARSVSGPASRTFIEDTDAHYIHVPLASALLQILKDAHYTSLILWLIDYSMSQSKECLELAITI